MLFTQAWYAFDSEGPKTQKKDSLYIEASIVDHFNTNFTAFNKCRLLWLGKYWRHAVIKAKNIQSSVKSD